MQKRIIILNQKGGVGKTTTSVNLSASLALLGKKVLLIDIDPQGNSTSSFGIDKRKVNPNIYDVLLEREKIENTILPTGIENLFLAPSNISLAGARIELVNLSNREKRLKDAISGLLSYDYIFIDPPPSLGILTLNGLLASFSIIIPIMISYYALEGLVELLEMIKRVKKSFNPSFSIEGVLITMFNSRTRLSYEIFEEVKKHFKDKLYKTIIPNNIRLAEAPSYGKPAILYDKASKGALSYFELAKEIIEQNI
ncbi:MAG: ParA family protein [bacterium]